MIRCQCMNRNGKGPQCSRRVNEKKNRQYCWQHVLCKYPISSSLNKPQLPRISFKIAPPKTPPHVSPGTVSSPKQPPPKQPPPKQPPKPSPPMNAVNKCDDLGGMINEKSSCYLDSLLFALFYQNNKYIDQILNIDISQIVFIYKSGTPEQYSAKLVDNPKLYDLTREIQTALKKIRDDIQGKKLFYCIDLRALLQQYQTIYNQQKVKITDINWINRDNEPIDMIYRLNLIFNLPDPVVKTMTSFGTSSKIHSHDDLEMISQMDVDVPFTIEIGGSKITNITYLPHDRVIFKNKRGVLKLIDYVNRHTVTHFDRPDYYVLAPSGNKYPIRIEDIRYKSAPLLHIHVQRIIASEDKRNITKITTTITPMSEINLTDGSILHLSAMIVHWGGTGGGHYVSYLNCQNVWYFYNDIGFRKLKLIGQWNVLLQKYGNDILNNVTDYFYT